LVDSTCNQMARYAARYVGWYTNGGFQDGCGRWHASGLRYNWSLLSVLNEDEYHTPPSGGVAYTQCWDAWRRAIGKVNTNITLIGPEIDKGGGLPGQLAYAHHFMNGSNHDDGRPPRFVSLHFDLEGPPFRTGFFDALDGWLRAVADPLESYRKQLAPQAEFIMNEYIPFNNEWCNHTDGQHPRCHGTAWK